MRLFGRAPAGPFFALIVAFYLLVPSAQVQAQPNEPAATGATNRITAVDVSQDEDRTTVTVVGSERPQYRLSTLVSPWRLIVDFPETRLEGLSPRIEVRTRHVSGVSLSEQVQAGGPRSRIVIHLRGEAAYRARVQGNRLVLRLTGQPTQRTSRESSRERARPRTNREDSAIQAITRVCQTLEPEARRAAQGELTEARERVTGLEERVHLLEKELGDARRELGEWRERTRRALKLHLPRDGSSARAECRVVQERDHREERASRPRASTRHVASSRSSRRRFHVVQSGEILSRIASRYGVTTAELLGWNENLNPDHIQAGQRLVVHERRPVVHRVEQGEVISVIAERYDVTTADIVRWNSNLDPDVVRAGQRLRIFAQREGNPSP